LEAPPPGAGLTTVISAVPAEEMSALVIAAVSWEALTKVVVRALPFHCTTAPDTKPVPLTVNVNAAPPGAAESGTSLCCGYGIGLFVATATEEKTFARKSTAKTSRVILIERLILGTPLDFRRFLRPWDGIQTGTSPRKFAGILRGRASVILVGGISS